MIGNFPRNQQVWLVTGAARGIGEAVAREARARGDLVVEGSRRWGGQPDDRTCRLDVTAPEDCNAAIEHVVHTFGRIDVLANVAGFGAVGAVEETTEPLARSLMETNFWGSVNTIRAALPYMRQQRSGRILNVSSLTGRTAAAGVGFYAASKFAIEGLSESLYAELVPFGIHATVIEPGGVRTDWAKSSVEMEGIEHIADYEATAGRTRGILSSVHGRQPSTPDEIAALIVDVSELSDPPRRVAAGEDAIQRIADYYRSEGEALEAANSLLAR